ncbi:MAG: HAD family phosphatase [Spirochaetaceae bacterium]|jgi:putative hydrolase of the HAD superfamily|nr:HAD family phosphatase [Spirochaetaceae bacterium]
MVYTTGKTAGKLGENVFIPEGMVETEEGGIKAVVFDYGGVISLPPEDTIRKEIAALAGIDPGTMDSLEGQYRKEYDRGVLSGLNFYKTILTQAGKEPDEATAQRMVDRDLESWARINPATVKLMEDIKAAGFKVGILSNMPHEFLTLARERFPVFSLPDAGIFSCEVGAIKPEEAIYEALFAALDRNPNEIVFVDDLRPNVEAARILGMNAFLWKDAEAARLVFAKMGIPV